MRVALQSKFTFAPTDVPASILDEFRDGPRYVWIKLPEPFQQNGHGFSYIVAPFRLVEEARFEQSGAGVLCQTEDEKKETFQKLVERDKKHAVILQWPGFGQVAWISNYRAFSHEIGVLGRKMPDGKLVWIAFERERDQDTLEVKVIHRKDMDTEGEANFWAKKWQDEYNRDKQVYLDSIGKNISPSPPDHCTELTRSDMDDLGKAKMTALRKQWPRCFAIFERQKSHPNLKIPDPQIEDAYILDSVGNGSDLWIATGGKKIRPDMQFISSLHKAAENYARRGKSKIIDSAIYLIAFNWELGWCYLLDEEIAKKIGDILETQFTAEQVKQYRYRTLGLVAKHLPGPPPNPQ
jgi:hypothetical protein